MIQIKPIIEHQSICPVCGQENESDELIWQGIHVCVAYKCEGCHTEIIEDLPIGHALYAPYKIDKKRGRLFGEKASRNWFGEPLLRSLQSPNVGVDVDLVVEKFYSASEVVIINCLDYLYGHALLKLLNAESYLKDSNGLGVVLILPKNLRWMIPDGIAEVWSIDISPSQARDYFPSLERKIAVECGRFGRIYLSKAYSHPWKFDITDFTKVTKHDFSKKGYRVTFIWREDRPWCSSLYASFIMRRLRLNILLLYWQNQKVRYLFALMKREFPRAIFTVAGTGVATKFPGWIEDLRVDEFTDDIEKSMCEAYSESRVVVGVHGSNMLLPSGHAGMTVDLMPHNRWGNFAQDILYQESDPRIVSFRYRFLPINTNIKCLREILKHQLNRFGYFSKQMLNR